MDRVTELEDRLGIYFNDRSLLKFAFIYGRARSVSRASEARNRPLAILGDAIIHQSVATFLFLKDPNWHRGPENYHRMISHLVSNRILAKVSLRLRLWPRAKIYDEAELDQPKIRHILGDALEGLVGAIFLDQGYEVANEFVRKHVIIPHIKEVEVQLSQGDINPMAILHNKWQALDRGQFGTKPPAARIIERKQMKGGKHEVIVGIFSGEREISRATGSSQKDARERAAEVALRLLER